MALKLNIGDPKSKRTVQIELDDQNSQALHGKQLGRTFKGELVDKPGYEFLITGGSDTAGFPMRNDAEGEGRRKILIAHGVGNRQRRKGMRLRRTVAGNTVSAITAQLNVKIVKHGSKPLIEEQQDAAKEEKPAAEQPAEKAAETPKEEKPTAKDEKPAEKKPEAPKDETKESGKPSEKKDEKTE